jgi:hypothetical protein
MLLARLGKPGANLEGLSLSGLEPDKPASRCGL